MLLLNDKLNRVKYQSYVERKVRSQELQQTERSHRSPLHSSNAAAPLANQPAPFGHLTKLVQKFNVHKESSRGLLYTWQQSGEGGGGKVYSLYQLLTANQRSGWRFAFFLLPSQGVLCSEFAQHTFLLPTQVDGCK